MKYIVVRALGLEDFEQRVNSLLRVGYKLQDGVSVQTNVGRYEIYCQAMTTNNGSENSMSKVADSKFARGVDECLN